MTFQMRRNTEVFGKTYTYAFYDQDGDFCMATDSRDSALNYALLILDNDHALTDENGELIYHV